MKFYQKIPRKHRDMAKMSSALEIRRKRGGCEKWGENVLVNSGALTPPTPLFPAKTLLGRNRGRFCQI